MTEVVAILGLFLFWASALWLPITVLRASMHRGPIQVWSIASIFAFGMVFMGFTRAMAQGSPAEAFAWSISWAMPVGLALFARSPGETVYRKFDFYLGAVAAFGFLPVAPFLPVLLRQASDAIW
ncbi:MAG: hypothetical protein AAF771_06295 [Pseudomonadota bacterium]